MHFFGKYRSFLRRKSSCAAFFLAVAILHAFTDFHTSNGRGDEPCKEPDAAIFIHIGLKNPKGAWSAAKSMMRALGRGRYCNIYYTTSDGHLDPRLRALMNVHGVIHKPASPFYDELLENGTLAYEFPTLHQLWYHCKAHPSKSVAYLQALGSHHSWSLRRQFTRRVLQGQVLHDGIHECKTLHSGRWHCGPNVAQGVDKCREHYSGNFWRASCEHVNTLDDPSLSASEFQKAMYMGKGHGNSSACSPKEPLARYKGQLARYWAEAWITHGHADIRDKLPVVGIQGVGDANVLMRTVHYAFFKHNINLLYLPDTIANLLGMTW